MRDTLKRWALAWLEANARYYENLPIGAPHWWP